MEDEQKVSHPHDGTLFSLRGKEILSPIVTWVTLEDTQLMGTSQPQKRQILDDFTHRTSL